MNFNIPYELCLKLNILKNVDEEHKAIIQEHKILKGVKMDLEPQDATHTIIIFTFDVNDYTYRHFNLCINPSKYETYINELYDYNFNLLFIQ